MEYENEKTLEEYRQEVKKDTCKFCNASIANEPIEYYPHDGGWEVAGTNRKQWLYITCPKCKCQFSLSKLGVAR